jgi:hypothetical protein
MFGRLRFLGDAARPDGVVRTDGDDEAALAEFGRLVSP